MNKSTQILAEQLAPHLLAGDYYTNLETAKLVATAMSLGTNAEWQVVIELHGEKPATYSVLPK